MSHTVDVTQDGASLRKRALAQLTLGRLDLSRDSTSTALAVLHQLASSPSTASDALALLHELQVHQVELELQQEELSCSRAELETALIRQAVLVERAPVGYMTIDAKTILCEINLAGARLLGGRSDDLLGTPLAGLLTAPSADALHILLTRARDGLAPETGELQLRPIAGESRTVHASADNDTLPGRFLLALMACAGAGQADAP